MAFNVCLIRVIEFGGSDQSGCPLHVYQANTFPTVTTYTQVTNIFHVIQCDPGRHVHRPNVFAPLATAEDRLEVDGYVFRGTFVRRRAFGGGRTRFVIIIERLSRTGPLFKIIEMFSTCVGRLGRVGSDL